MAVSLVGVGVVRYWGRAEGPEALADDGDEVAASAYTRLWIDTTTTTIAGATTTVPAAGEPSTTTTTAATGATTSTPVDRPLAPGSTAPPTSTAAAPTTTAATGPRPDPVIHGFDGHIYGDTCADGQHVVSMWWDTEFATTARLRPRDGTRFTVAVDGTYNGCADVGDEWVLNAMNDTGTETATFVVRAP